MTRAQQRWQAFAAAEAIDPDDIAGRRVIVAAGPGYRRRARRALASTGADFAQVVSRRGSLVFVIEGA